MSCCRLMLHLVKQFINALRQGFMEFCARGCIVGAKYLVQPNYHKSERLLWMVIFLVASVMGFSLLAIYLRNYSQNIYRVVYEDHGRNEPFNFPSVGICELGTREYTGHVERVLETTVYPRYPRLKAEHEVLKHFLNLMAFQGLQSPKDDNMRSFINYTKSLPFKTRYILFHSLDYRDLVEKIRSSCTDFFVSCHWQEKPFDCCELFTEISTMLGKCFILNSFQNYSETASRLIQNITIYSEPYRLYLDFKKPAQLFLLNRKDIPETITPIARYSIVERNLQLNLEFTIVPTINDKALAGLDSNITNCINSNETKISGNKTYLYQSYSCCITDCFFTEQLKDCGCTNLYHKKPKAPVCKLRKYACLEKHGFINPLSMIPLKYPFCRHCFTNCKDSEYLVNNLYYNINGSLNGKRSLELILLNFPTKHKRRQVIRQSEDKLLSLSGILCLCLGFNVVNIIEFLYLFVRALVRQPTDHNIPGQVTKRKTRRELDW